MSKIYSHHIKKLLPALAALMLLLIISSCERRELWLYGNQFKQVEVDVDWRNYDRNKELYPHTPDPGGMTLWFFPKNGHASYSFTTSNVRHYEFYLGKGEYEGLVIDYSPSEYGRQEFVGMDYASTAKVQALPSSYQPESEAELYGPACFAGELPSKQPTGLYTVSAEPEQIASDTIHMNINSGKYAEYIPYKERDEYESTLVHQFFKMQPLLIPWQFRVRVDIKGIYYLYQTSASIAGLADGYFFMTDRTSDTPCVINIDNWEVHYTGDNVGYIAKTFNTWGVRNSSNHFNGTIDPAGMAMYADRPANEIRLNLRFLLRDRQTVRYYHYDVANLVRTYWDEYVLRVDLTEGFEGLPDLPYVEAYEGMGFGGVVVPWDNNDPVNVDM